MPSSCEPRARVVLRPGPINFIDLHPRVATELPHGVNASFDWIFQWRESLRGGVYSVPGFLLIPAGKSSRALRRAPSGFGGTVAGESSPVVSS